MPHSFDGGRRVLEEKERGREEAKSLFPRELVGEEAAREAERRGREGADHRWRLQRECVCVCVCERERERERERESERERVCVCVCVRERERERERKRGTERESGRGRAREREEVEERRKFEDKVKEGEDAAREAERQGRFPPSALSLPCSLFPHQFADGLRAAGVQRERDVVCVCLCWCEREGARGARPPGTGVPRS